MNYENWISLRYMKSSKGRFLKFLNFISIAGIAIGVASLIVVISVMTGFGKNIREKIIGTIPHVMIEKETGLSDYETLKKKINTIEGVTGTSAYVQGNVYLEASGEARSLIVRGVQPESENQVTKVDKYLIKGRLQALDEDSVIIGKELARYFGFDVGDQLIFISPRSGIMGEAWRFELTVAGIFDTGMYEFDQGLVLTHIRQAQKMFQLPPEIVSGVGVQLLHPNDADIIKKDIYGLLGYGYLVKTWIDNNRNLFEALKLEKWGLFLILTLMVIVASFNIISTLIVTVTSKTHDIGILQSIGVPRKSIRRIFTKQGMFIGSLGTFWGLVSGLALCYILRTYVKVPKEIYTIDRVPVELVLSDIFIIIASALTIVFLSTIYPAAKAASLQPVDALRYE